MESSQKLLRIEATPIANANVFVILLFTLPGAAALLSHFNRVQLCATPWTVTLQAPLSMGTLQARILERVAMPFSRGYSRPRDRTQVFHIADRFFII